LICWGRAATEEIINKNKSALLGLIYIPCLDCAYYVLQNDGRPHPTQDWPNVRAFEHYKKTRVVSPTLNSIAWNFYTSSSLNLMHFWSFQAFKFDASAMWVWSCLSDLKGSPSNKPNWSGVETISALVPPVHSFSSSVKHVPLHIDA